MNHKQKILKYESSISASVPACTCMHHASQHHSTCYLHLYLQLCLHQYLHQYLQLYHAGTDVGTDADIDAGTDVGLMQVRLNVRWLRTSWESWNHLKDILPSASNIFYTTNRKHNRTCLRGAPMCTLFRNHQSHHSICIRSMH